MKQTIEELTSTLADKSPLHKLWLDAVTWFNKLRGAETIANPTELSNAEYGAIVRNLPKLEWYSEE